MKLSVLLFLLFSCLLLSFSVSEPYTAIFSFGDSLADTGNHLVNGPNPLLSTTHPPYGMTFFRRPTGRCSDGRLVLDFITEAFGLPLLPPSKAHDTDFHQGANFAITGGTAMSFGYFHERGLDSTVWVNGSLSDQVDWFEDMKPSLCSSPEECKDYFSRCLFIVGEFGGNDYNAFFFAGRDIEEVRANVHIIVGGIVSGVERLINNGAVDLVVPGVFPIGCFPLYLKLYGTGHKEDYGHRSGCLKKFNSLAWYHNEKLIMELEKLRKNYPQTRIVYADYYGAAIRFNLAPKNFGFTHGAMKACCGDRSKYNVNMEARCGTSNATVCHDPETYASWDGVHYTEAAHRFIAKGLLEGPYAHPPLMSLRSPKSSARILTKK
ncbi:GDSL esterase/lipase At5g45910-like [Phoenix dactylifera]|uniref:GDSL esterase/lipase At5g45910-like n=1 Tax=Phoenix dactylifera TaxID=42345 RepID=A0A8B7BRQ6_PHODC|nr:GDSL esterase/lipase At5g45910-like [Phoenix dactylifera]